jgi:hypothetical protein
VPALIQRESIRCGFALACGRCEPAPLQLSPYEIVANGVAGSAISATAPANCAL